MNEIDSLMFIKKCQANILKCLKYDGDSVFQVNKVLFKYSFGKISETEANQLKKILAKKNGTVFNIKSNIIINFRDSLYDYKARKRLHDRHIHEKTPIRFTHKPLNSKSFNNLRKKWIKRQKKCVKKVKRKFNTETFYVYNYDYGSIKDYPDLNWIKDRGSFKNVFFNIKKNSSNLLILKPNGEYFLSGGHFSDEMLEKLLQNNWSQYKNDLNNSYKSLNKYGIGIFETNFPFHKKHCF